MSGISQSIASPIARPIASPLSGGGGGQPPAFVSNWDTTKTSTGSSNATSIAIPTVSGGAYNCVVDWGDGTFSTITTWNDAAWTHDYGVGNGGLKTITITGQFWGLQFNDVGDKLKIKSVASFGSDFRLVSVGSYFHGCSNLTTIASDLSLAGVTDMQYMFSNCTALTTLDVSGWNVSSVTSMRGMFQDCTALTTLDVLGWDVSNVTTIQLMFQNCTSLTTLDVLGWDVSSVTSMQFMFQSCTSLTTLDVSGWNVSNVTTMHYMFNNCPSLTSLDISGWDVSAVTNMANMFTHANMTTAKYSDTLNAWSLLTLEPNVNFAAGPMKYNAGAVAARAVLTGSPNNWTITDGGPA